MIPQIEYMAEDEVVDRTAFQTDLLFFHHRLELGMVGQMEAVANPLRAQQHGVIQETRLGLRALPSMKVQIERQPKLLRFAPRLVYLRQEVCQIVL